MKAVFATASDALRFAAELAQAEGLPRPASQRCGLIPRHVSMLRAVVAPSVADDGSSTPELDLRAVNLRGRDVRAAAGLIEVLDEQLEVEAKR